MNFLASPTIVTAMSFSGKLSFNPITDSLTLPSGEKFKFTAPSGQDLPSAGFTAGETSYYPEPTPAPKPEVQVVIKPDSQRLELLEPFTSHFGPEAGNLRGMELPSLKVLMRVRGKCTTDHISAAVGLFLQSLNIHLYSSLQGPWLKYKGHLTNISENLCMLSFLTGVYSRNHN
jgi:homoaconitase